MKTRPRSVHTTQLARLVVAVVAAIVAAAALWVIARTVQPTTSAPAAYGAQPERNFMAIQRDGGQLTAPQVVQLAHNYRIIQLNSADAAGRWAGQADDARRIVALNPSARVYAYYAVSYMSETLSHEIEAFDPAFHFPETWYLRGASGQPIAYAAGPQRLLASNRPYFVDLSNPQFRTWLIALITKWMRSAPWAGIKYDNAEYIVGNMAPTGGIYGRSTMNDVLCGPGAWDATGVDCPRVSSWNAGLRDVISQTVAALHPLGKAVFFNGIAPTTAVRPLNRMLGLLTQRGGAEGALDESFCFLTVQAVQKALPIRYTNVVDDIRIMQNPAYANKQLLFQSNYFIPKKLALAHYCIAAFLMGWQPGRDFYRFGASYKASQLLSQPDPSHRVLPKNGIAEIDLNLGNPRGSCIRSGDVLFRRFDHGFVAVNMGALPGQVTLPPTTFVQFSDGQRGRTYEPSSRVTVAPHDGVFLLTNYYLHDGLPFSR